MALTEFAEAAAQSAIAALALALAAGRRGDCGPAIAAAELVALVPAAAPAFIII